MPDNRFHLPEDVASAMRRIGKISAGDVAVYGPRRVTREEIVAFAAEFDPQPMHLDEAAARPRCSAGWPHPAGTPAA